MRNKSVWQQAFGLTRAVVEDVVFDDDAGVVVVSARPVARARSRCGRCGRRSPGYDRGDGRRQWRALDLGTIAVVIEADAPRVSCRDHGPTVAQVPWARHGVGHTRDFDDYAAWLAVHVSKSAVVDLLRVAWATVGSIVSRVSADIDQRVDRLAGLRRIGIDEISYKRGHRYLTVVVDHDSGRLVWARPGRNDATLNGFFDLLGPDRCAQITHVSADGADWIGRVVPKRCPNAVLCADPFHVVAWATHALDTLRGRSIAEARARARTEPKRGRGRPPKGSPGRPARQRTLALVRIRHALWKNPENLTANQAHKLAWIAKTDPRLHRGYLLKEGLRTAFVLKGDAGKEALDQWISWARRCRIPEFVELQRKIVKHRATIDASLEHRLSNGLIESTNTKIRLLTRIAFGFHGPEPLIALALLALGGHTPDLPGRK